MLSSDVVRSICKVLCVTGKSESARRQGLRSQVLPAAREKGPARARGACAASATRPRGAQGLRRSPDYVRGLCPGSPGRVRSVAPRAVVQGVRGAESRLLWSNVSATEAASSQQRRGIWNDAQRPKCKVFRLGCCHGTPPPPLTADAPARRRKVLRSRVLPRGQVLFRAVASRHGAQPRWHGAQSAPLLRSSPHAAQTNTLLCPLSSSQSVPAALR